MLSVILALSVVASPPSYAAVSLSATSSVTMTSTNTYYQTGGTTQLDTSRDFQRLSDNRIRYTATPRKVFQVCATFTLAQSSGASLRVRMALRTGAPGVDLAPFVIGSYTLATSVRTGITLCGITQMVKDTVLDLAVYRVTNGYATSTALVSDLSLSLVEVGISAGG